MTAEGEFVTVMCADLPGFTAMADAMDPEAVRELLNSGAFGRGMPITFHGQFLARNSVIAGGKQSVKTLLIYDSQYGNTAKIAQAIGDALSSPEEAIVLRVSEVQPEQWANLRLLIVGSPTQQFRPTAAIKKLVAGIPARGLAGVKVAAFDTRIPNETVNSRAYSFFVRFFGYAAKPIADALVKKGGQLVAAPEGFIVTGMEGPLKDGELERAAQWARQIRAL